METKKVKRGLERKMQARLCWPGDGGRVVSGQWEDEETVLALKAMLEVALGRGACWVEYQH